MPLYPYGVSVDLGATPFEVLAYDTNAGGNLGAVLGERADYDWRNIFDPARIAPVGTFGATFLDWYDTVDVGDANNPDGGRFRSINQFPTVNASDSEFAAQASVSILAGSGAGASGACSVQHTRGSPLPVSYTAWAAFKYVRPATNNAHTTIFSMNKTGTGAWLYILRADNTFDRIIYTPDQQTLGANQNSFQLTPLADNSEHIIALSVDGAANRSEIWLDGTFLQAFTHSGAHNSGTTQFLNFGNLTSGLSPMPKIAFGAISGYPMARRSGSALVQPDMLPRLFDALGDLYGIAVA